MIVRCEMPGGRCGYENQPFRQSVERPAARGRFNLQNICRQFGEFGVGPFREYIPETNTCTPGLPPGNEFTRWR